MNWGYFSLLQAIGAWRRAKKEPSERKTMEKGKDFPRLSLLSLTSLPLFSPATESLEQANFSLAVNIYSIVI